MEKTGCGKGSRWTIIAEGRRGLPIGVVVESARPGEILKVESTVESIPLGEKPRRLIGDKAYFSRPCAEVLWKRFHTELIAPPKSRYRHLKVDHRKLRRLKRRWKVERLFAWLRHFFRLNIRRERYLANYKGFLLLACLLILARYL